MGKFDKIYQMDLPHRAVAVYCYFYERANENGECWLAIDTIACEIKLSRATIKRANNDLMENGAS